MYQPTQFIVTNMKILAIIECLKIRTVFYCVIQLLYFSLDDVGSYMHVSYYASRIHRDGVFMFKHVIVSLPEGCEQSIHETTHRHKFVHIYDIKKVSSNVYLIFLERANSFDQCKQ